MAQGWIAQGWREEGSNDEPGRRWRNCFCLSLTRMLLVAQAEEVERQLECAEEQLLAIQQARVALEVELKWVA